MEPKTNCGKDLSTQLFIQVLIAALILGLLPETDAGARCAKFINDTCDEIDGTVRCLAQCQDKGDDVIGLCLPLPQFDGALTCLCVSVIHRNRMFLRSLWLV